MSATKELFKTAYGKRERNHCPVGSQIVPEYTYVVDTYGRRVLEQTGEHNIYDIIQESLEETKIENVLARAVQGDTSGLRANGQYIDTTTIPNNLIEAKQAIQALENTWYGLPQDIRSKYNNNIDEFVASSGSNEWLKDMGLWNGEEVKEVNTGAVTPETIQGLGEVKTKPTEGGTSDE